MAQYKLSNAAKEDLINYSLKPYLPQTQVR